MLSNTEIKNSFGSSISASKPAKYYLDKFC